MNFDINSFMQQLIIQAPPLLFALTVHELAHGYVAFRLGDPTAKNEGRLTLNPLKHLDPLGVLAFIIMKIGWAKPVPVNPWYFKNPRQDMLKVALAGPGANVVLAVASAALAHLLVALHFLPFFFLQPVVAARGYAKLEPYGFFILLGLFYTGVISWLIMPIIRFSNSLLLG